MGTCIVVVNQKGGVGKTTTAVNIGAALAEGGCRTLLVDLDPQANATAALGMLSDVDSPDQPVQHRGMYASLCGDSPIREQIEATQWTPLFLVPSTVDLAGVEVELAGDETRQAIKRCLQPVIDAHDIVILDTPPSLGIITVNCLVAADSLLIPVQCEYFALEGLRQLLKTVDLVRDSLNPRLSILGLLRTMHDGRTNLSQQVAEEIERFFPGRVFETLIPRNVRLSEAPSFGQPVTQYSPNCPGTRAYRALAAEIAAILHLPYEGEDEPAQKPVAAPEPPPPEAIPPDQPSKSPPAQEPEEPGPSPWRSLSEDELIEID